MNIAYVRVSTVEQNEARQVECLKQYNIEKWFMDKMSAGSTARPELQTMLEFVREGDRIYIHDFSRLARNTNDLMSIIELLKGKKVQLISSNESIDTSTPTGKLMVTMIAAINEFERAILLERQKEGIAIAKGRGTSYFGRAEILPPDNLQELIQRIRHGDLTRTELARQLGISRPTLQKMMERAGYERPVFTAERLEIPDDFDALLKDFYAGTLDRTHFCAKLNIDRLTLGRMIKQVESDRKAAAMKHKAEKQAPKTRSKKSKKS